MVLRDMHHHALMCTQMTNITSRKGCRINNFARCCVWCAVLQIVTCGPVPRSLVVGSYDLAASFAVWSVHRLGRLHKILDPVTIARLRAQGRFWAAIGRDAARGRRYDTPGGPGSRQNPYLLAPRNRQQTRGRLRPFSSAKKNGFTRFVSASIHRPGIRESYCPQTHAPGQPAAPGPAASIPTNKYGHVGLCGRRFSGRQENLAVVQPTLCF